MKTNPAAGKKIFLLRHDQVVFPDHHDSAGQPIGGVILGQLDYPIANGHNQPRYDAIATIVTRHLMAQGTTDDKPTIFFAGSDLLRVRQTFNNLQAALARRKPPLLTSLNPLATDKNFREQHFGAWHGMTYAMVEANHKAAYDLFWQDFINQAPPPDKDNQGESFITLYHRATAAMEKLLATRSDKNIMLVVHDGVIRALLAFFYQTIEGHKLDEALTTSMACKLPYLALLKIDYEIFTKPVIDFL